MTVHVHQNVFNKGKNLMPTTGNRDGHLSKISDTRSRDK